MKDAPSCVLIDWEIWEVDEGEDRTFHFVGYNILENEGRVSSSIVSFDPESNTGVTRTGRRYELRGEAGWNKHAAYVWSMWLTGYGYPPSKPASIDRLVEVLT